MTRLEIALASGVIAAMASVPIPVRAGQHREAAPAHPAAPTTKTETSAHEPRSQAPVRSDAKPVAAPPPVARSGQGTQAAGREKTEPVASNKEPVAVPEKQASAESKAPTAEPKSAGTRRPSDGPRVSVTRVDTKTGMAEGPGKPAPASRLEEALTRINDRIEDGRPDPARRQSRPASAAAPRIRLSWRTSLEWPAELVGPSDPDAHANPSHDGGRVSLIWK